MIKGAEFSPCGKYRYVLWREWDVSKRTALCIGLNPSTANAEDDDQTIIWLTKGLTALGYGGFRIVNLYALISPDPKALRGHPDPWKENNAYINVSMFLCQEIVFCWGNFKEAVMPSKKFIESYKNALCFGRNKNGSPWHPLAMMYKGIKPEMAKLERYAATP